MTTLRDAATAVADAWQSVRMCNNRDCPCRGVFHQLVTDLENALKDPINPIGSTTEKET